MKKILLPILFILASCGRQTEAQDIVFDLLASTRSEITNLSEIASDVQYIPLQTVDQSLIKYIYGMKTGVDKYYINTLKEILCFSKDGRYLYNLSKNGRGPEEYTYINDWDICPSKNILAILVRGKILFYTETGDGFVYSKVLNCSGQPGYLNFGPDQNSILLSYRSSEGNEPFRYLLINLKGDTIKKITNSYRYEKTSKWMFASNSENVIFGFDKRLNFKFWLSDTVYTLDRDNRVTSTMIFDSHGKQITTRALAEFTDKTMSEYLTVNSIMESSRYLFYRYYFEKAGYYKIYDKVTKKLSFITMKSLKDTKWLNDDITGGVDIEPKFCINGILYASVEALTLKKHVASDAFKNSVVKNPEKKKALQKLADSLDETDNPVLIIVTPKN
jgi:hypothetical protein